MGKGGWVGMWGWRKGRGGGVGGVEVRVVPLGFFLYMCVETSTQ